MFSVSEDLTLEPVNPLNSMNPLNKPVDPKPDRFNGAPPSLNQNPLFRLLNPQPDNIK